MKELKVKLTAVCTVPDEFKLTPRNYTMFSVKHRDDDGTERQMILINNTSVEVKELKIRPAQTK